MKDDDSHKNRRRSNSGFTGLVAGGLVAGSAFFTGCTSGEKTTSENEKVASNDINYERSNYEHSYNKFERAADNLLMDLHRLKSDSTLKFISGNLNASKGIDIYFSPEESGKCLIKSKADGKLIAEIDSMPKLFAAYAELCNLYNNLDKNEPMPINCMAPPCLDEFTNYLVSRLEFLPEHRRLKPYDLRLIEDGFSISMHAACQFMSVTPPNFSALENKSIKDFAAEFNNKNGWTHDTVRQIITFDTPSGRKSYTVPARDELLDLIKDAPENSRLYGALEEIIRIKPFYLCKNFSFSDSAALLGKSINIDVTINNPAYEKTANLSPSPSR